MSGAERRRELLDLFGGRLPDMLADLEALVTRESPSDDAQAVTAVASWVAERLSSAGVAAEAVPCPPRGAAVVARVGPETGGNLLLGHLDTVWPVGTLATVPFHVGGTMATGPGVFDMKGGAAVILAVLTAIAQGKVTPRQGLAVILTPDEEEGGGASRDLFVPEARRRDRVLVLEPAGDAGAAKIARKGIGVVRARFLGVASHAGLEPEKGASALLELARFALYADALADREIGTTVVPTLASAGSASNVVPERGEVTVDCRAWSAAEVQRVTERLLAYRPTDVRVYAEVDGGVDRAPMEPTPASLALFEQAVGIAADLGFPLLAARVGGVSDGNLTAAAGVPTLDGLGPRGGGAHARSEHLEVDDLPRRAALLAALLEEAGE